MAASKLSSGGKVFFSSLCVSTFGLGCWQTKRYFEKVEQVEERNMTLAQEPIELETSTTTTKTSDQVQSSFRPIFVSGKFRHEDEILVGPRGPPIGSLSKTGPNSGRSSGGMASSPMGYYCLTPLERSNNGGVVIVNRGWVPRSYIEQNEPWYRPKGNVKLVGISSSTEQPRFMSPPHDPKQPKKLLWFDREAIEDRTKTAGKNPPLMVETREGEEGTGGPPFKPDKESVGEFTVLPSTHAGYAVTWFGLSSAGIIMTRKLITRGR
jgi:surfeit locus 1 family protein